MRTKTDRNGRYRRVDLEPKEPQTMGQVAEKTSKVSDGRQDFDFFFGSWRQANRKRVNMVVPGDTVWVEFESYSEARPILGGLGNIDTYDAPQFPGRPAFKGFSLRLFEPETGLWRIWWASTAAHGRLDEPVVGRFRDGIGVFECDDVIDGVSVSVRFTWKDITPDSATWEQSFSFDNGATWDTNWITRHRRIAN
jgi:hypothetical protein